MRFRCDYYGSNIVFLNKNLVFVFVIFFGQFGFCSVNSIGIRYTRMVSQAADDEDCNGDFVRLQKEHVRDTNDNSR